VHVPFCSGKCSYCDFYSITDLARVEDWLDAVLQEARLSEPAFHRFDTLYLGGGTPSILDEGSLSRLLDGLRSWLRFAEDVEITLEANPEDVRPASLAAFRRLGVNRISLGIQSLDPETLAVFGRRHTADRAKRALEEVLNGGFQSVSADLIFGAPGRSPVRWLHDLESVIRTGVQHIFCYELTVAPDTPLGRRRESGRFQPSDDETLAELFLQTAEYLGREGYVHYEVSNYALPGHESRHNRKYWRRVPYLGLGPAAHSYNPPYRWWNPRSVRTYCERLAQGLRPEEGRETLSPDQDLLERLGLGFRTREGMDLDGLPGGADVDRILRELQRAGLIIRHGNRAQPTSRGFLVADSLPGLFIP
jgi:oxygen-independent coproporphyrinogen-3 oxidase